MCAQPYLNQSGDLLFLVESLGSVQPSAHAMVLCPRRLIGRFRRQALIVEDERASTEMT